MMFRIILVSAIFMFTLSCIGVGAVLADLRYSDVSYTLPGYFAIEHLSQQNLLSGYEDHTFRPNHIINRAEFLKIAFTTSGRFDKYLQVETIFSDVPRNAWYAPYIAQAAAEGLISGYGDGTFHPEYPINFAEAAKILMEVYEIPTEEPRGPWFQPLIQVLYVWNIVPDTVTLENQQLTRMEAVMLIRDMDNCAYEIKIKSQSCYGPAAGSYYNIR